MNKTSRVQGAIDRLLGALRSKERKVGGLASGLELRDKDLRAVSGGYIVAEPGGYASTCEGVSQGRTDRTRIDD